MIYLIQSSAYVDNVDSTKGFENILKIGYTKDESKDKRFEAYKMHNPTCIVLYTIPNCTELEELLLHKKFNKFKRYRKEWFSYDEEIINFFKIHTTFESLDDLRNEFKFDNLSNNVQRKIVSIAKKDISNVIKVNTALNLICSKYNINCKEVENLLYLNIEHIEDYININYPDIDYREKFSALYSEIDDLNSNLDHFYSLKELPEKYKFLCSLEESDAIALLPHLPSNFINYYTVLGPQRMQALRYNSTDMKKEYDSIIGNQGIDLHSYLTTIFLVGERYSMSETKKKLKDLYTNLGYNKTPKASDIETYFEVRVVNVVDSITGKRGKGFEIIKIKD